MQAFAQWESENKRRNQCKLFSGEWNYVQRNWMLNSDVSISKAFKFYVVHGENMTNPNAREEDCRYCANIYLFPCDWLHLPLLRIYYNKSTMFDIPSSHSRRTHAHSRCPALPRTGTECLLEKLIGAGHIVPAVVESTIFIQFTKWIFFQPTFSVHVRRSHALQRDFKLVISTVSRLTHFIWLDSMAHTHTHSHVWADGHWPSPLTMRSSTFSSAYYMPNFISKCISK